MKDFYNTIGLDSEELKERILKAKSQEEAIIIFFLNNQDKGFTPFEVQSGIYSRSPVTSIRRAISNLTEKGFLVKTDEMRIGNYNEKNHTWKFRKPEPVQETLF